MGEVRLALLLLARAGAGGRVPRVPALKKINYFTGGGKRSAKSSKKAPPPPAKQSRGFFGWLLGF